MLITLDTTDSRTARAFAIADQAAGWLKCRASDGSKRYGIRSERNGDRVYLVSTRECDCQDAQRHPGSACKHQLAVRLHLARIGCSKPQPASTVLDGLAAMAAQRTAELATRHADVFDRFAD